MIKNLESYLESKTKDKEKDSYSMSIRELVNMYETKLVNLSPVYQRNFRWDDYKASKLIESIFMGIPLPQIFISVRKGKWDIIDGVQRISSILWYFGKLKEGNDGTTRTPLKLKGLEELENLNDTTLDELREKDFAAIFKFLELRRLDVVLLTSNDVESEYQLFSRLNTGGITLSAQEIRNFLIVKLNSELYDKLREVEKNGLIKDGLSISQKQIDEDYRMELLIYFLIISKAEIKFKKDKNQRKGIEIYKEFKTKYFLSRDRFIDKCISSVLEEDIDVENEINKIKDIFEKIKIELEMTPFRKGSKFSPFLYIALISYACNNLKQNLDYKEAIQKIQETEEYSKKAYRGTNVVDQFITGIEIGRDL